MEFEGEIKRSWGLGTKDSIVYTDLNGEHHWLTFDKNMLLSHFKIGTKVKITIEKIN